MNSDIPSSLVRDLTKGEEGVYLAALEVLRLYFTGEMEYGLPQPVRVDNDEDDDDKPPSRQLQEGE